jgi:hypothetical protein
MQADRVDTALAIRIAETEEARQRLENELLKVRHSKQAGSYILCTVCKKIIYIDQGDNLSLCMFQLQDHWMDFDEI